MDNAKSVKFSVLDLAPIIEGGTAADSFRNSLDLARHAEQWGYSRYWVAEHHSMPGIASAATSVVIGYIAAGTTSIRVGSGGIMLPNHAPLMVAEQFGTLETMYPGRIDLGLGRAPGTDNATMRALRRDLQSSGDTFPQDLIELQSYLLPAKSGQLVRAVPGNGLKIPIYLLGSSDFSAMLAAELGLPFAFASHFAPDYLYRALKLYRSNFKPSEALAKPYAMVGVNVFAADENEEARRLTTSLRQQFLNMFRGKASPLAPPVDPAQLVASTAQHYQVDRMLSCSMIGAPEEIGAQLGDLIKSTAADELIMTAHIYDHKSRLMSFEVAADAMMKINSGYKFDA